MSNYLAIYKDDLRYELALSPERDYVLANTEKASLYIDGLNIPLHLSLKEGVITYAYEEETGQLSDGQKVAGLTFYLMEGESLIYDLLDKQELLLGKQSKSDIYIADAAFSLLLQKQEDRWLMTLLSGNIFLNNLALSETSLSLDLGAELSYHGITFKIFPDEIWVMGKVKVSQGLAQKTTSRYGFYGEYPDYHRSPRIIYRSSEDKIQINAPSAEPKKPENGLLRMIVPPLVMLAVMLLISLVQPRGIYILMMAAMSVTTVIFSVTTYIKNRKKYKQDLKDRIDSYKRYVMDKSMELNELAQDQKKGQLYHYPAIETLDKLSAAYNHRIYEKTPLHFDFLHYRLGLGKVPTTYELRYSQTERSGQTDPLEAEGYQLYMQNRTIDKMPIVANLAHGPVGYIGPRPLVIEQLQLMVNQLAFFHSYHDVQFITIMPEEELSQWEWLRWLPHATLQEMNVRGFVYNQRTRDQVLNSLNQILKLRKNQLDDKSAKESLLFSPHYVVLVTDEKLILDHVIMEFFSEDPTELGCSVIFVEDVLSSLSENIKTIINIKDRNVGQLVIEEGELRETDFALDHFPADYDKEAIARRLAPLNHLQNLKSSIPDSVTFMEMYHAEDFKDLHVQERWAEHAPYKSLAVPLGLRGQDDIVYLNLHEKAHGPHGLIAGTTGSGKSELIQSYILSLAVNFHPYDVAFLLIDYKGGGMANLFKELPHLLGTITNLDGAQSMRALTSINAELKRRQRLFAKYDVNHINQYQKKYKLGEVAEPLPHLFLISDEFAELKQEQPDFMSALVSTARTGRSLGIHLILATQKPAGVVNDQIWSNSRFKIALKVADRQDSNEMLHTPDAAEITQTGRAYLQVGNNEVYELFQSAWSGAEYQPDKDDQGIEDHTIYAINALGQYDILNEDLSGLEDVEDIRQVPSELDAIVTNIRDLTHTLALKPLARPWLPPLEERIFSQDVRKDSFKDLWQASSSYSALMGIADIPSQQAQHPVYHDFEADGNLVLFSAPGMGKSTFLQTLIMDLARQNKPDQLHVYLLDFGTNGLLPLQGLPHVADSIILDENEKISKFVLRMQGTLAERKKLLAAHHVSTISMYRQVSGDYLPEILIAVDSYDGVRDAELSEQLESILQVLSRDGSSLGINLVITAARLGILKMGLQSNVKTRLTLKLTDDSESRTIMGRHDYTMEDQPGRGLIHLDDVEVFQVTLPARGQDSIAVLQALQDEAKAMSASWQGARPQSIPIVPEELSFDAFMAHDSVQEAIKHDELPLGLDMVSVENVSVDVKRFRQMAYLSDRDDALVVITKHLIRTINQSNAMSLMLLDADQRFSEFEALSRTYLSGPQLADMAKQLVHECKERESKTDYRTWAVVIPDFEAFVNLTNLAIDDINYLLDKGPQVGIHLVIGSHYNYIGAKQDAINKSVKEKIQIVLLGMKLNDQSFLEKVYNGREEHPAVDEVYLHNKEVAKKIKITYEEDL